MSKQCFNTHAMLVTSRSSKKQRKNIVWIRFAPTDENNDALSADECLKTRTRSDLTQDGLPKSGKHPTIVRSWKIGSTFKLRSFKSDTVGEAMLEKHGSHAHDVSAESFKDDLPHHCKEWINKSLKLHCKLTSMETHGRIQEEFTALLSPEERSQIISWIDRNRKIIKMFVSMTDFPGWENIALTIRA